MIDLILRLLPGNNPVSAADVINALTELVNREREARRSQGPDTIVTIITTPEIQRKALGVRNAQEENQEGQTRTNPA